MCPQRVLDIFEIKTPDLLKMVSSIGLRTCIVVTSFKHNIIGGCTI